MNTTIFNHMISRYNELSFTHNYIWGFDFQGTVYFAITKADVLPLVCKLDRASRGAGMALRFCPTVAQKVFLLTSATPLCSSKFFTEQCDASKYNKGEIFEKLITEHFGQVWEKDNVPFTKAGDLEVKGVAYQIKYQKATFCNEKSLTSLSK